MKKVRLALLAAMVAVVSFAFTVPQVKKTVDDPVYAFDNNGLYLGSGDYDTLDAELCIGSGIFCAHVWTDITSEGEPAGTQLPDLTKEDSN